MMDFKAKLEKCKQYRTEQARIRDNISRLRESVTWSGTAMDGMPHSHTAGSQKMEQFVAKLTELEEQYRAKTEALEEICIEVDNALDQLDPLTARILQLKCIDGKTWVTVSRLVHLSVPACKKRYAKLFHNT